MHARELGVAHDHIGDRQGRASPRAHVPIAVAVRVLRRRLRAADRTAAVNDSGGGDASGGVAAAGLLASSGTLNSRSIAVVLVVAVSLTFLVLRFVSEGALIEGVVRARRGGSHDDAGRVPRRLGALGRAPADRAALRRGTHGATWRLLLAPCVIAWHVFGPLGAVAARPAPPSSSPCPGSSPSSLVQAFAVPHRRAREPARARRHRARRGCSCTAGSLHGLKLMVATFLGTLAIGVVSDRGDRAGGAAAGGAGGRAARSCRSSSSRASCCCRWCACSPRCWARSGRRSGRSAT